RVLNSFPTRRSSDLSLELIKLDLGNANTQCGGEGADVRTNKVVCNPAISFMNQTCTVNPNISRNCEQTYVQGYLHSQNLNQTQQDRKSTRLNSSHVK